MFRWLLSVIQLIPMAALAAGQPDLFSHKRHAALKLECAYCHSVGKSARAGLPSVARCMLCHKTMDSSIRLPSEQFSVKFHRLPDFVFFSHAKHFQAKVACTTCHAGVWEQDRPQPGVVLKMKTCVDCHKASHAKVACESCHELAQ